MNEAEHEHLIAAIDAELDRLYNEAAVAEEEHNEARIKFHRLEEAVYNLEKQRRELMV